MFRVQRIVGIDQTGYVSTIYDTGDYKLHHDYIFDDNKNLIVLASKERGRKQVKIKLS